MKKRLQNDDVAAYARVSGPLPIAPRLLDLQQAAAYLNVSTWTVRDWVLQELFPIMRLPARRPREGERARLSPLRRVLIDVRDLDAFIDRVKGTVAPDVQSSAQRVEAENIGAREGAMPRLCPRGGAR